MSSTATQDTHMALVAAEIRKYPSIAAASKAINLYRESVRMPNRAAKPGMPATLTFASLQLLTVDNTVMPLFMQKTGDKPYPTETTMFAVNRITYSSNGYTKDVQKARAAAGIVADVYPAMPSITIPVAPLTAIPVNDYAILSGDNSSNLQPLVTNMNDCCTVMQCLHEAVQDGLRERVKDQIVSALQALKVGVTDPTVLRTLDAKIRCASSARICGFKSLYQNKQGVLHLSLEGQTPERKKMDDDQSITFAHRLFNITDGVKGNPLENLPLDEAIALLRRDTLVIAEFKFVMMTTSMGFVMQLRCFGDIQYANPIAQTRGGSSSTPTLVYNGVVGPVVVIEAAAPTASKAPQETNEDWEGE